METIVRMLWISSASRGENLPSRRSTSLQPRLAILVVLVVLLAKMPPTLSVATDCGKLSGYVPVPVSDTCTVQLSLNDTESEVIRSQKEKYHDFPLRCRLRK